LHDMIDISKPRLTKDGFLAAEAHVARTGIQMYRAAELGMDGDPNRTIRVYRPPDEVFATDAMASYAYRPVTVDHPQQMVDAKNWKEHARGQTGGEVLRDGEFVRVPMLLMDEGAINDWKAGKRELSMGYEMDLEMKDGSTPEGEQYDAVQRNLRMNHLALVARARGGSQLKLGDTTLEDINMSDVKLKTVTVDGLAVETTDAGAQAISKLSKDLTKANDDAVAAATTHKTDMATKDAALAAKDAEIDKLKGSQLSDTEVDQLVKDRADLIATAKSVADKDYNGLSAEDIRKTAVTSVLGADALTDKSPEYIQARFDILAEDAEQDPVRRTIRTGTPQVKSADAAYDAMVERNANAYKGTNGSAA